MLTRKRKRELQTMTSKDRREDVEDEAELERELERRFPRLRQRVEAWAEEQVSITLALMAQAEKDPDLPHPYA